MAARFSGVLLVPAVLIAVSTAQAASPKELFEKQRLLATFARDCGKPASRQNYHFIHRPIDGGRVQRDVIDSATTRVFLVIVEQASERAPDLISISGTREGKSLSSVYRIEQRRMRILESTVDGKVEIVGGRFINGAETPWLNKCGAPDQPASVAPLAGERMQIAVDGRTRDFLLYRPAVPGPRPTIIALHGLPSDGARMAQHTGLDRIGPQRGFAAVFPDGLRNQWNHFLPGKEPRLYVEKSREVGGVPDDVGFLRALAADLVRRGVADPNRLHLVGASNGGFMALRMICADAGLFAAVGLLVTGMPGVLGAECQPAKPLAVMMVNGTADQVVPFAGGMVQPGNAFPAWSTERLTELFSRLNGCAAAAQLAVLPDTGARRVELARWSGCASGAPVVSYRVIGAGHDAGSSLNIGELVTDFFRDKVRDGSVIRVQPAVR